MSHPRKTAFTNDFQSPTFLFVGDLYNSDWAALAQLVEHIIRNDGVRCSSHLGGTIFSTKPRELEGVKNNPATTLIQFLLLKEYCKFDCFENYKVWPTSFCPEHISLASFNLATKRYIKPISNQRFHVSLPS